MFCYDALNQQHRANGALEMSAQSNEKGHEQDADCPAHNNKALRYV